VPAEIEVELIERHAATHERGAMLAGVDYVLMGAGIPRAIPGALDLLAEKTLAMLGGQP